MEDCDASAEPAGSKDAYVDVHIQLLLTIAAYQSLDKIVSPPKLVLTLELGVLDWSMCRCR